MKTNYCITFINAFKTSFSLSKDDAIKTDYCITIFKQFWTCFKYDGHGLGLGMGCLGLAWAGETKFVFLSKSFPWQRYVFQEPQSSWLKITLLTVLHVQLFIHLANYFRSTEPFCFSIGVLHSKCLDNLVFASLVWNIDYQGIVNHKVVMDCWDWRKFLGIISTSLEFRICYRISNCQVCIYSINYWFNQYYSGV